MCLHNESMATSLTGVGAVWASLSLLAAILCCSGFYLPFWIQVSVRKQYHTATGMTIPQMIERRTTLSDRLPMNETKPEIERDDCEGANNNQIHQQEIIPNACTKEEPLILGHPDEEDDYAYSEPGKVDVCMLEARQEEGAAKEGEGTGRTPSEEVLLAAWWDYKRKTELKKKKKKKLLTIYRDENYWTSDRYTDDEDFNDPDA